MSQRFHGLSALAIAGAVDALRAAVPMMLLGSLLVLAEPALAAPPYHAIDISGQCNARLQSIAWGQGSQYPEGDAVLGGVPFSIRAVGGNNIWWARGVSPDAENRRTLVIPVNIFGVTEVYTLINTTCGLAGPSAFASIEFFGAQGAYYRKDLIGDSDIRDYLLSGWTNNINGTTSVNVFTAGSGIGDQVRLDRQLVNLAQCEPAFATQELDHLLISDWGGSNQEIFIAGLTVTPEPATLSLLAIGGIGMLARQRRRGC